MLTTKPAAPPNRLPKRAPMASTGKIGCALTGRPVHSSVSPGSMSASAAGCSSPAGWGGSSGSQGVLLVSGGSGALPARSSGIRSRGPARSRGHSAAMGSRFSVAGFTDR